MQAQQKWQKIISYTPVAILIQSLSALFIAFFFFRPHRSDWTKAVIFCLFYGVISTVAIKAYVEKYIKSLGLSTKEQSLTLAAAFKKGEIPENPKLKAAMPTFLEKRLQYVERQRKWQPFTFFILSFFFLGSMLGRYWPGALLFGFMTGVSVYGYISLNRTEEKVSMLQVKLGVRKEPIVSEAKKKLRQERLVSRLKSAAWLVGIVLALVLVLPHLHSSNKNKDGANKLATQDSDKQAHPSPFTSSRYDFTIEVPGKPKPSDYSMQSACDSVPFTYTMFSSSVDNNSQVYTMYAIPWPKQDADFVNMSPTALTTALDNFLNEDLQANNATQAGVKKTIPGTDPRLYEEIRFSIPGKGYTTTGYLRVFTEGNTEFDLMAQNTDEGAFENFANSFRYTGPSVSMPANPNGTMNAACIHQVTDSGSSDTSTTSAPSSPETNNSGNVNYNNSNQNDTITINND